MEIIRSIQKDTAERLIEAEERGKQDEEEKEKEGEEEEEEEEAEEEVLSLHPEEQEAIDKANIRKFVVLKGIARLKVTLISLTGKLPNSLGHSLLPLFQIRISVT